MQKSKPANSQWTDEQWQAITETGQDILVAAAAGSGKTAVLVERIIRKITDPENPIDIDRLLIVTFSNAAAAEMRSRIGKALEKALSENPGSLFLRRQLSLLNKASIMTCHAFCLSVVKRYYYLLDLDPSFRIIDETEGELLREEVMESLFEDYYSREDHELFYGLVDRYSNDRNDSDLQELILKIYHFSGSHPWPEQWLDEIGSAYHAEGLSSIEELTWTKDIKAAIKRQLLSLLKVLDQAEALCNEPGGPTPYLDNIREDRELIQRLADVSSQNWEACYKAFQNIKFKRLKSCKGEDFIEGLKDRVSLLRKSVKDQVTKIQENWFKRSPEAYLQDLQEMAPYVDELIHLVKEFSDRYRLAKLEKGVVDFSDLEHYCLNILRDKSASPSEELPSSVAEQYRAQFEEVLVDEYQDTNLVQETILQLISRDQALGGNLFMVGDVKQSIYRFRLAEPGLFLTKYKQFGTQRGAGCKIDLAKNFRSRQEVIDGTNFIFKQIMDEEVGEIDYDEQAELKLGASYPEAQHPAELVIINRKNNSEEADNGGTEDWKAAELEACHIAEKIKELIGKTPDEAMHVYDKDLKRNRPIQFRDIVILIRSAKDWAPVMIDILKQQGIPAYAELSTGYFDAVEVSVMMSLLKVIDNPYQDIPLASVLRSPIVGLNGDELAKIRLKEAKKPYYDALKAYLRDHHDSLADKVKLFLEQLQSWRSRARSGALADLIWQIYRETGYYDYVVGQAGGNQRQANLKALYDRARQYERTSFRGLFRFLRFIERMRERGSDFGEARALSEQEDVVRIMTIHKSKGLEYPVVFVAGLNKQFNESDLREKALLHKNLGFGTRNINPEQRLSLPTLPFLAIKQRLSEELLAEEMRVLYVALTRAKEKLYLIGTVNDAEKAINKKWGSFIREYSRLLPAFNRRQGKSYLDWIAPAVIRHHQANALHEIAQDQPDKTTISLDRSSWVTQVVQANELLSDESASDEKDQKWQQITQWEPVQTSGEHIKEINERLTWQYPYHKAASFMAKQTVTEIKRQQDYFNEGFDQAMLSHFRQPIGDRPRFLQKELLSATEKGTAMHMMMQHVDISREISLASLKEQGAACLANELMTPEQEKSLDYQAILRFFESQIGQRVINAARVVRECPFSLVLDTNDIYSDWQDEENEQILVQGVIDCLIEDEEGLTLIDYKTDQVADRYPTIEEAEQQLKHRYKKQMALYKTAIEQIWKRKVQTVGLWSFDIGRFIEIGEEE
ncbi:ATP-dependent helicase/nuclease subunit A [Scopulibacillus daqui]|uniref:ATP-dependent helicase/nuclease subunit A n=2 Tax=Scopulibacillus daqui TaxID=1469162 RepID=A0ABS2PV90_9BACL|nr:helicase-exonuclease AddAB subunit AddA [Scopulibacillus daqui]MBM7643940.1 ATP-dependent helicase/nuclease subunit A [Scopulibacillus daqui]